MNRHVLHVGFHASEADALDAGAGLRTAVMPRDSAARLPAELAARFARIALFDVPDSVDLDAYDRAIDQIRARVTELAAEFGAPTAIVGLYEHTTLPAARLRADLGLPGTGVRTALLCRDKVLMKRAVRAAGLPVPRFLAVGTQTPRAELSAFAATLPGRVVLKPRSQGASFGVRILDGAAELLAVRIEDDCQVEEFVTGAIYHCDGVVRDGAIRWFSVSRYLDSCFDFQHRNTPLASVTLDEPDLVARVREFSARVLAALGLTDSAFHLEAFHTPDDRLVFLEIGNRFGGAGIPWHQRTVFGVDLAREAVLACTGEASELAAPASIVDCDNANRPGASGWLYLPLAEPGRVVAVTGLDDLPGSVIEADIPAVGAVLGGAELWPTAGRFLLGGASTTAVEQDMAKIAAGYAVKTVK